MIAQVDEQQVAVIALAMNPSGEPDFFAGVFGAELAAIVRTVLMHGRTFVRIGGSSLARAADDAAVCIAIAGALQVAAI